MRYNERETENGVKVAHLPIKAIYGNVAIMKYWCPNCDDYAFVIKNEFQCCGLKIEPEVGICRLKREAEGSLRRKQPPPKIKKEIMAFQNHQCLYCGRSLRGKTPIEWDHFFCFKYSCNNSEHNMVASCRTCNQIKSAMIFPTVLEARLYILHRRETKGLPNYDYFGGSYDSE